MFVAPFLPSYGFIVGDCGIYCCPPLFLVQEKLLEIFLILLWSRFRDGLLLCSWHGQQPHAESSFFYVYFHTTHLVPKCFAPMGSKTMRATRTRACATHGRAAIAAHSRRGPNGSRLTTLAFGKRYCSASGRIGRSRMTAFQSLVFILFTSSLVDMICSRYRLHNQRKYDGSKSLRKRRLVRGGELASHSNHISGSFFQGV